MGIGEWIGGAAKGVVEGIATPFSNAWIKTKESAAATHKVDKETDRDITIESYRADVQFAMAQRLLAESDRTHWSTRWIRPAFALLSFGYFAACLFGVAPILPPPVEWVLVGIPGAIFVLRPLEKNKRADIAANAQKPIALPASAVKLLPRFKREDAQ